MVHTYMHICTYGCVCSCILGTKGTPQQLVLQPRNATASVTNYPYRKMELTNTRNYMHILSYTPCKLIK